jgi:hypothetical protein
MALPFTHDLAAMPDAALLWIYRARLPLSAQTQGWSLQGRFASVRCPVLALR